MAMPEPIKLKSLAPEKILEKLDLGLPGLEAVKAAADRGERAAALEALLEHYRMKYPLPEAGDTDGSLETADKVVDHVLQWGPYEEADYGPEIDWEWDPRGDIEWVAAVYRFYWASPLAQAYVATRDEKYARTFVELTQDWIRMHRLEDYERTHPVYTYWHGFVWLDIQTGIRATNICQAFRSLVHGEAFTGAFLGDLLASLFDHQVKTEQIPMGRVHNKAVFEQRGFINIAYTFQEFTDARRWMELGFDRAREVFLAQSTTDGVQREWSYGYHQGVLRDAVEIQGRMESVGIPIPEDYLERIRRMHDYIFAVATPDLGAPMFGDASRSLKESDDRATWPLHSILSEATELLGDPKYAARANLNRSALPDQKSYAFAEAGMYVMRDDWGPQQIHLGLHCSPKAISAHDQPDNGTFELCAYGRWLMPDTGFYTYGHSKPDREWHRQTRVHQTLTLDGADSRDDGRHLLWASEDDFDALTVENRSYGNLTHRRTVWFPGRRFYVLLDEAIGRAQGEVDLHFQFAPGDVIFDHAEKCARTDFSDANVLVWTPSSAPVEMTEEEGWFAWSYGHRTARKAFRYRLKEGETPVFLTVIAPFRGTGTPEVSGVLPDTLRSGQDEVELELSAFGEDWTVGRDLEAGKAWCRHRS
jgi:heparan-sulfate lyase